MISSVLMSTINSSHPQRGMMHAFRGIFGNAYVNEFDYLAHQRQGMDVARINTEFYEKARVTQPDWIWLQLQDTNVLTPDTLRRVREMLPNTTITHWTGDCRPEVSPYLSSICAATHISFISSVGQLPMFRKAGAAEAHYLQIGVDWAEDVVGEPGWLPPFDVPDVVFCGNYYAHRFPGTVEREDVVRALQAAGINVGIVGNGWPEEFPVVGRCHVKQQAHVYRRAKVGLNINNFNGVERFYSDRQLISMVNVATACWAVPNLLAEFAPTECAMFESPDEAVEVVSDLLDDAGHRRSMYLKGRATIIRNHTWLNRVLDALATVESLRGR